MRQKIRRKGPSIEITQAREIDREYAGMLKSGKSVFIHSLIAASFSISKTVQPPYEEL